MQWLQLQIISAPPHVNVYQSQCRFGRSAVQVARLRDQRREDFGSTCASFTGTYKAAMRYFHSSFEPALLIKLINNRNKNYVYCELCAEVGILTRFRKRDILFSTPILTDPGA
jgi:hypothetical protein